MIESIEKAKLGEEGLVKLLDEKIENIRRAQREGLKVCSGGIIGMGEGIKFINSYGQMRIYKKEIDSRLKYTYSFEEIVDIFLLKSKFIIFNFIF